MGFWFTMEKLRYYGKYYDIIENTMLLWTKLWYYTGNYRTSIYEDKNMVDYQKLWNFD